MGLLFMILLLLILLAALPTWPYSRAWGYYPSGAATLLLIVVILMVVFGALDFTYRAPPPPM
jgi:ABC-type polysaccharide/polyol phosphate export permease